MSDNLEDAKVQPAHEVLKSLRHGLDERMSGGKHVLPVHPLGDALT